MTHTTDSGQSRRNFLRSVAVSGVAAGAFATVSLAQDDAEPAATFALDAYVEAWQGVAPDEIAGQDNPTLSLTPGETYRLVWRNGDGQPHNFAILDGEGNPLEVLQPLAVEESEVAGVFNNTTNVSDVTFNATNATGNATGGGNATDGGVGVTEILSEEGAVQAVEFEASEEMAEYYCQVHPQRMRGEVSLDGGAAGNDTANSS